MTDLKGGVRIVSGNPLNGEAVVIDGKILVKVVPRGTPREGIGVAKIKGGNRFHLEAEVILGALKVKV
jgi:hypothetical protein